MADRSQADGTGSGTRLSRRTTLALAGIGSVGGLLTGGASASGPRDDEDDGAGRGRERGRGRPATGPDRGFDVEFSQPGIAFERFATVDFQPQGMAYRDDRLYAAQVTDSPGNPSTIHELALDGSPTGETFTLPNDDAVHTSGLEWHDDRLWAIDYAANRVFAVDWGARRVVGSFRYGNGVLSDENVSAGTFVPTRDGGAKLLLSCWRSNSTHLIDHEAAIEDGTAAGNVSRVLQNGPFISPQGLEYHDGELYVNWDVPGTNSVTNAPCPYADGIPHGFSLSDGLDWWTYQNTSETALQDLAYDPDREVWYTAGEYERGLFRARERPLRYAPQPWNVWDVVAAGEEGSASALPADERSHPSERGRGRGRGRGRRPAGSSAVLDVDADAASGQRALGLLVSPFTAWTEVWYYDDTAADKRVYAAVSEEGEDRVTLGVNGSQADGADRYYRWNSADGWEDTGVERPDEPRWIRFGWHAAGDAMRLYVSTDGETWEAAGVETGAATRVKYLHLEAYDGSQAYVGPWSLRPFPFD